MTRNSFSLKKMIVGALVLLIVGYAAFNSRFIVQGPEIVLENVGDSVVTKDKTLFLTGKILHSSFISINGRPIFVDEHGTFNEKLLLSSGVSIIDIYAKDKFGKEVRRKIDVLYDGSAPVDLAHATGVAVAEASAYGTSTDTDFEAATLVAMEQATTTKDTSARMSLMSTASSSPPEGE